MTMPESVAAVPGISSVDAEGLRALAEIADRHGWDIDGLAGAISHESGWNPTARNPNPPGAVGILQWTPRTLARYGTNAEAMLRLPVAKQLPYVERFFSAWEKSGYTIGARDFLAFGLGVGNWPAPPVGTPIPGEAVLYAAGSDGANWNPEFQDSDGAIRMGKARLILERIVAGAGSRPRIVIPSALSPKARLAHTVGSWRHL